MSFLKRFSGVPQMGLLLALVVFVMDRASKWWIVEVFDLPGKDTVYLLPFLDLTMVWNRGISMGLLRADSDFGRYLLIALTGAVAAGLTVWLWRVGERLVGVALGLVIGGAVGNIWDRFEYGAVADFVRVHGETWSFYVFNVADAAISVGVAILLLDALLLSQKPHKSAD